MKTYIGTKIVKASPMSRAAYNAYCCGALILAGDGADDGYMVEYTDGGKPNVTGHVGYVSWSPKEQFDNAYIFVGDVDGMPAHQQRVLAEKAELDKKTEALSVFIEDNPLFGSLVQNEQDDLVVQHDYMSQYASVLASRIERFSIAQQNTSPRTDDNAIEQEIQAKGLTAPRVTPADIEANIVREHYGTADQLTSVWLVNDKVIQHHRKNLALLTICVLVLRNGFTVTGESACASPENFDAELGRKIARENAVQKVWPLMGYALKERLYEQSAERAKLSN